MTDKFFKIIEKITPARWHWILQHEGHKKYFANTGWMFGGQMFSLSVSFFIGAWVARYLGPENYGVLNYAIAFVGLFAFVSSLGVDGILNRELIKTPEKRDKLLGTAFRLKLIGGVSACCLATISIFSFGHDSLVAILVSVFSVSFVFQTLNIISIYFQAEAKAKNNTKALFFATIISAILKVVVILSEGGVIWLVFIYALDLLWQGVGFVYAYNHIGLKIKNWRFDKVLARLILKNSWLLMLASGAWIVYVKIDQVMIGHMLGNYKVGIYSAAVKLVEIWYFIPGIICASLFPALINARKISSILYKDRLKNFYILMIIIPILMAIPISFLAKPIIFILFGSGYLASVNILRIYVWSSVGLFLGHAVSQYLMAENLIKTIFWLNIFAMVVNIGLNLIFIPRMGITGAAWATLVSFFVVPVAAFVVKKTKRKSLVFIN